MKLYFRYLAIHVKSQMQYKTSFFLTLVGQFLTSFSAFLAVYFMMERFHSVEGFTFSEVLLCFATVLMAFSLAECFARGFDSFSGMIGNGEFDRIMVRPRNEIFQVLTSRLEFSRIGRLLQAIVVFCYAIPTSGVLWTAGKIFTLVLMVISGTAVFSGLFIISAAICFFTTEGLEVINIFTNGGLEFGQYPLSIYGEGILKFFTFVVPLALFQYYPFLYLIGQAPNPLYCFTPLFGFLFLLPCMLLWRVGIHHYKSTGS